MAATRINKEGVSPWCGHAVLWRKALGLKKKNKKKQTRSVHCNGQCHPQGITWAHHAQNLAMHSKLNAFTTEFSMYIENHRVSIMKFKNAASSLHWKTLKSWRGRDNAMNSYEAEEIAEITAKWSAFHLCQVHRQLFFCCCLCPLQRSLDFISVHWTDNRQQATDNRWTNSNT